jgi:hypothetical protein
LHLCRSGWRQSSAETLNRQHAILPEAQKQTKLPKETDEMATKPTHEQAQLHLQVFEQRREPRLRQARDWFFRNYFANTMEEAMKIAPMGTEEGTNVMMVFGYWEQTCALLNYGLLHEDLFFETSGEFFGVWERVKSHIEQGRQIWNNKSFLSHLGKRRSVSRHGMRRATQETSRLCAR